MILILYFNYIIMSLDKQNLELSWDLSEEKIIFGTRSWIDSIKKEIISDVRTLDWYISVLNNLLQKIKDIKENMKESKKWLSKSWKTVMKETKIKLERYEKQIKLKREALLKGVNVNICDEDLKFVRNLWMQINELKMDVWLDRDWLDK